MEGLSIIKSRDGKLHINDIFRKGIVGALNGRFVTDLMQWGLSLIWNTLLW